MLGANLSLVSMADIPCIVGGKASEQQPAVQRTNGLEKVANGVE